MEDKQGYLTIRLPDSVRAELTRRAEKGRRSVSAEARWAIEKHLAAKNGKEE